MARQALIVVTHTYDDTRLQQLRAPEADARQLESVLRDETIGGYEVEIVANAAVDPLRRRIERFFRAAKPDDTLLLHFSCHGLKRGDGELCLAARDTSPDELDSSSVEAAFIRRQMNESDAAAVILLLDCCLAGRFGRGLLTRGTATAERAVHLDEWFKPEDDELGTGRFVLCAADAIQFAIDSDDVAGDDEPSFFTGAVVDALRTGKAAIRGDEWLSVDELADYVKRQIAERTNNRQTPQVFKFGEKGRLRVARNPAHRGGTVVRLRDRRPRDYTRLKPITALETGDEIFSVAFAPDGRTIVAGTVDEVLVWSGDEPVGRWTNEAHPDPLPLRPGGTEEPLHDRYVYSVAVSGAAVASGGEDAVVRVTALDGTELLHATDHNDAVYSVTFSPDGTLVASGGWDGRVYVWELATRNDITVIEGLGRVSSVAFSPNPNERLLAIGTLDDKVLLLDVDLPDRPRPLDVGHTSSVEAVTFSPDGALIASCGLDKTVRLWNVGRDCAAWADPGTGHHYLVRALAFAPDGTLVSASWDKTIKLWKLDRTVRNMPRGPDWSRHGDWIWSVAFSDDGTLLASAGSDGKVVVWALPEAE